jgi:hypothetical protein
MKRFLTGLVAGMMLLPSMAIAVWADEAKLPFTLQAPKDVSVSWLEGNDSPTTMAFAVSQDNEMAAFYQRLEQARQDEKADEIFSQYDFDDIYTQIQVDWAIDDVEDPVSGWHYDPAFWDADETHGFGYDTDGNYRVSDWDMVDWGLGNATETVQEYWIMRGVPNDQRWNGNPDTKTPGVKDQLKPEQYTYSEEEEALYIDFNEHTAYFRARWVVVTYDSGTGVTKYYFSDWSDMCAYGKDAQKEEAITASDIPAPKIVDLRMTDEDFNGQPVLAFTLEVPDEVATISTKVSAAGGAFWIDTEARLKGDEEWILMSNTDSDVKPGEMKCALVHLVKEDQTIPDGAEVEIRCRYLCSQPELDDISSEYSEVLTFQTKKIEDKKDPTPTPEPDDTPTPTKAPKKTEEKKEEKKCWLCGFCPCPLGLCIFIWIAILIVITVVVIVIVKKTREKKKDTPDKD